MTPIKFKKFSTKASDYSSYDLLVVEDNHKQAKKLFCSGKEKGFQIGKSGVPVVVAEKNLHKEISKYSNFKNVAVFPSEQDLVQLALIGYEFDKYKSKKERSKRSVTCVGSSSAEVKRANELAKATCCARDLVNTPASDLTPKHLASLARKLGGRVTAKIYTKAELKKMGCGGILAVSQGSAVAPCLIHLRCGPAKAKNTITLIGKGVTFDSGGYSLKTSKGMEEMKCDMAGAASVMGLFEYLAGKKKLPKNLCIHGVIPCAENMVNSSAQKPGDVYKAMNGTTVEVLNTDAEGRLLLADAICFAQKKLKSSKLVTLATLTGAAIAALGDEYAALLGNSSSFTKDVLSAANSESELLWEMPLAEVYKPKLDSKIADIKNNPGTPGTITAALFLDHFVEKGVDWSHIDLAGPSFISEKATGYGVRTLIKLIETTS